MFKNEYCQLYTISVNQQIDDQKPTHLSQIWGVLFIIDKVDEVGLDSGGAKVQQAKLQQANNNTHLCPEWTQACSFEFFPPNKEFFERFPP